MANKLTVAIKVIMDDEAHTVKPLEDLTPEEHDRMLAAMAERLSHCMSDYYTQHPEELQALPGVAVNKGE